MKTMLEQIGDRVLFRLGLELDFSVDLRERFFSEINRTLYLGAHGGMHQV